MKSFLAICLVIASAVALAADNGCAKYDKTTGTLAMVEARWVRALDQKDTKTLGCILGKEFIDSGVEGQIRDRDKVLNDLPNHPRVNQHFRDMKAAIIGDTGVVHGINHVVLPNGVKVDVRFTDTFVHRDGS